jgi:uncharacterized repeat protein (TIGR03803 family)
MATYEQTHKSAINLTGDFFIKKSDKNVLLLPLLLASLVFLPGGRALAQTLATLHVFTARINGTNSDGANPHAALVLSGNTLYGTADIGGNSDRGTVFAINTDGTGFTNLHNFTALVNSTNSDGASPYAGLTLSGNILYGTTQYGGSSGNGTVFKINTDGMDFTNLHNFTALVNSTNSDGINPQSELVLSGNTLYGTALIGGYWGNGTVFKVNTDGTDFTNLYSFSAGVVTNINFITNTDGAWPQSGVILSSNILYGTTWSGGSAGNGTVFKINTDGTGFTNLYFFTATPALGNFQTNGDGANPYAGLILSGNTLYGTAQDGGSAAAGNGTVFAVNTDGTGFTNLHNFNYSDGAFPDASLILSGNTLYGTASGGGLGRGAMFAVNTNGMDFTNLYSFRIPTTGGMFPDAGLVLSGYTLYGTAEYGGVTNNGTVFSLSFKPPMTIISAGTNIILTWPTNFSGFDYTGFTLQSATNLDPAVWNTLSPASSGQFTVTNAISGSGQFYRLIQ